jgi:GrpB-like predicted nucleotidyltransferase (UPF0157 family)
MFLKPYNSFYSELFTREKIKLASSLGDTVHIEHIGSTAVANLGGKGIIDIMIGIPKGINFDEIIRKLDKIDYEHREKEISYPCNLF